MQLTVADVLALPVVAAGRPEIRVGGAGLGSPVRWVHVSELTEVAGTLHGGELILSTGMGLRQPGFDGRAYLGSLRAAGAVGLVVELGQHVQRLDDDLVRAARAARLPLIELARNVRFVAVTEAVHALILNDQYEKLRFSERVLEEFAAIGLGTATTGQVLERAATLAERTVVLEDLAHRAVAFAGGPGTEALLDWERRSRRAPSSEGGPEGWVTTPVGPAGERWGRLVVPSRVVSADDRRSVTMVLERASEALTVVRLLERASGVVDGASADLLRALMGSTRADEPELRARARALGLSLRGVFAPLVVRGRGDVGSRVARGLARARVRGVSGQLADDGVGVLLGGADAAAAQLQVTRFVTDLHTVSRAAPEVGGSSSSPLVIAGGEPASTLAGAGEGLLEAAHVARVAEHLPGREPGHVYRNADLGARGLLWWMRDDPRLTAFAEGQLGALLDGPRAADDLRLLRLYLETAGSVTRTAEALGLSRPGAYARLQRLEARLGRPLQDAGTRLSLQLALLARELL
jgi:PucR family transcriptional regulator, purine catabolism regulatory protein